MTRSELRDIPSVTALSRILLRKGVTASEQVATELARTIQAATREALLADPTVALVGELDRQLDAIESLIVRSRYRRVINATGIVVHTNLGRAPVSAETALAMQDAASGSVALEIDPDSGRRGGRMEEISRLVRLLTGAESALVVNNNAAAILLVLSTLSAGKRVAVSRAEAVEIGGGFRIPDVLRQSGAELVEVGTTNRTYAADYRNAELGDDGVILKVHSSNFSISGFVANPCLAELRGVSSEKGWLLVEDLGSGTLVDTETFGMEHEPTIQESIDAGVDVVTFSGDKLLGGPQAGVIAGRGDLIDRIASAPLARAVRADKMTLAGVAATLRHYLKGDALDAVPVLRMMNTGVTHFRERATSLEKRLSECGLRVETVDTTNYVGGGSLPGQSLPGVALRLQVGTDSVDELARRLRTDVSVPVYGRIEEERVFVELRTVAPEDDDALRESLLDVMQ